MLHYAERNPWNHYFCTYRFGTRTVLLSPTPSIPRSPASPFLFLPSTYFSSSLFSVILFMLLTVLPRVLLSSVGRLLIEFSSQMTMERVQKENPNVTEGGRYTPPDCRPRWKVCKCLSVSTAVFRHGLREMSGKIGSGLCHGEFAFHIWWTPLRWLTESDAFTPTLEHGAFCVVSVDHAGGRTWC